MPNNAPGAMLTRSMSMPNNEHGPISSLSASFPPAVLRPPPPPLFRGNRIVAIVNRTVAVPVTRTRLPFVGRRATRVWTLVVLKIRGLDAPPLRKILAAERPSHVHAAPQFRVPCERANCQAFGPELLIAPRTQPFRLGTEIGWAFGPVQPTNGRFRFMNDQCRCRSQPVRF